MQLWNIDALLVVYDEITKEALVVRFIMVSSSIILVVLINPANLIYFCRLDFASPSMVITALWSQAIFSHQFTVQLSLLLSLQNSLNSCVYRKHRWFTHIISLAVAAWLKLFDLCLSLVTVFLHHSGIICFYPFYFSLCGDISCFGPLNPPRPPRCFDPIPLWLCWYAILALSYWWFTGSI